MIFTSTRNNNLSVPFSQATRQFVPGDGGVFVPATSSIEDLRRWIYYIDENTPFTSIAGTLTSAFIGDEFSPIICETIATSAFPFEPKVVQLDDNLFHMELYNGYTGCHRDFGVSYLCSYFEYTNQLKGEKTVLLDFSHGELGALLSKVLHGKKNIKAVIVYKKGTVRGIAEEDLAWNGGNIYPVEMEGTEEEIKAAIKKIYADRDFVKEHHLTAANTTNICRLLGQLFYFPYAFSRIKNKIDGDIYYAFDSGNYGLLMACLYSWRFALPLNGIYLPSTPALCNDAKGNPMVLDSMVKLDKRDGVDPISPANIERLESFFDKNEIMIRNFVNPAEISERDREKAAKELFIKYKLFADPGTAAAYATILKKGQEVYDDDGTFVLISQNHPSLSADYCRHVIGETPEMPQNVQSSMKPVILERPAITSVEELKKIIF